MFTVVSPVSVVEPKIRLENPVAILEMLIPAPPSVMAPAAFERKKLNVLVPEILLILLMVPSVCSVKALDPIVNAVLGKVMPPAPEINCNARPGVYDAAAVINPALVLPTTTLEALVIAAKIVLLTSSVPLAPPFNLIVVPAVVGANVTVPVVFSVNEPHVAVS